VLDVLIVDDKPAVLEGLRELVPWLEIGARIVGEAGDGQEALAIAVDKRPDVVITDIRMPHLDGLQLCEALSRELPHTVKIILSAYEDFSYAQSAIRFEVKDYILKPIDYDKIDLLTARIRGIAARNSTRQTVRILMNDPLLQENMQTALKNGDSEALALFFAQEMPTEAHSQDDTELFKNLCLQLQQILFDFVEKAGFNWQLIGISKEQSLARAGQLDDYSSLKEHCRGLYLRVSDTIRNRKNSRPEAVIDAMKTYILNNFNNPDLTVYTLADKLKISANYAGSIFFQNTGSHITNYIAKLRMDKALELLRDPTIPIQQIALEVGYMDSHYFARAFKKAKGFTPSQYRNLHVGMEGTARA